MAGFQEVQDQIDWARTRIQAAETEILGYLQSNAFALVIENDSETGEEIRKIVLHRKVPVSTKGYLRNAILDIKHSFDMSLNAAALALGANRFKGNYPWADSLFGLQKIIDARQRKLKTKIPDVIRDEIFRQEPYATGPGFSGGNDLIREMAKIANDKHTIGVTAAAKVNSFCISNIILNNVTRAEIGGLWDPIKKEIIISKTSGEASYDDPTFTADVIFEGTGEIMNIPAVSASKLFADKAQLILDGFKSVVT